MEINPPKRWLQFLRWFCREDYLDELEGDLTELYRKEYAASPRKAGWVFTWRVLKYVRPEFIKPFNKSLQPDSADMYKNYFTVALRNLSRQRNFTFIHVAGLTLGIACALFIHLIVTYEQSYDRYHAKAERVYRINQGLPGDADTGSPHGLAGVLRSDFPEVEEVGIIVKLNPAQSNVEINKELFRETNTYLAQPSIFKILDFTWLQGSPESLGEAHRAVVAQSIADKYFKGDAVGKVMRLNNNSEFTITGIIADPPMNTDFPAKIIISYATMEKMNQLSDQLDAGTNSYAHTYLTLREGADPFGLDAKLKQMVERHVSKERQQYVAFSSQPLTDIHFNVGNFNQRIISKEAIGTLRILGLVIMAVACINFINLASAQAIRRAKEVGVRKTLGSSRSGLVMQFLCETFLVASSSLILALLVTTQLISFSASLFNIPLSNDALLQPDTLMFLGGALMGVTLLSGFYPAFVLSRFRPATALKGSGGSIGPKGLVVRKGLITVQFLISQVLIICTVLAIRQTNFFLTKPLGFNKEAVVTFDLPNSDSTKLTTLRNKLMSHHAIHNVSFSLNTPSATINKWWANVTHASFSGEKSAELKFIDSAYLNMFEIKQVAGSVILPDHSGKKVIVNEDFVRMIGMTDPEKAIGESITYWGNPAMIIGVVKDFQTVTLRQGMHPVIITSNKEFLAKGSVKINMEQSATALSVIDKYWKETFPGNYFEFAFLDDQLATFYKDEKKISRLLVTFASVAITIGCIGLFGLIALVATQRAKEVSIRKILGASVGHLAAVLSSDFMKLVLIAGLIAWPIAYYLMDLWLQGFMNRIVLYENPGAFGLSLLMAISFALITVSFQTIKAARANPVDRLRTE